MDAAGEVGLIVARRLAGQMGAVNSFEAAGTIGGRVNSDPNATELDQPFRFGTKYYDEETGLYYFGHRYYNPTHGRWLNRDRIGELGGVNLYAYAANEPIGRHDPLGDEWILCPWNPYCFWENMPVPPAGCPGEGGNDGGGGDEPYMPPLGEPGIPPGELGPVPPWWNPNLPPPPPTPLPGHRDDGGTEGKRNIDWCERYEKWKRKLKGECERNRDRNYDACDYIWWQADDAIDTSFTNCVAQCKNVKNPEFGQIPSCMAACSLGAGVVSTWQAIWYYACLVDTELGYDACLDKNRKFLQYFYDRCHGVVDPG